MKRMNILVVRHSGGRRTSITVSDLQLDVLDRLADFEGISRNKLLENAINEIEDDNINVSNYVRDYIIGRLLTILSMKGVDL